MLLFPLLLFQVSELLQIRKVNINQVFMQKCLWLPCIPFAFASDMMILSCVMLSMQFVGEMLPHAKLNLGSWRKVAANEAATLRSIVDTLQRLPPRKPPDPSTEMAGLLEKEEVAFKSRKSPRKQDLKLGLLAALNVASKVPHMKFMPDKGLRKCFRSCKRHGCLNSRKVKGEDLTRLRNVLDFNAVDGLLKPDDCFEIIADTGGTVSSAPHMADFVPGTLKRLPKPVAMEGIGGNLAVEWAGIARCGILNNRGEVTVLETLAHWQPAMKVRLFSPQAFLCQLGEFEGHMKVFSNQNQMCLENGDAITFGFHPATFLPILHGFHDAMGAVKTLALGDPSLDPLPPTNVNLSGSQKVLFRIHCMLGHLNMAACKWLGRMGLFSVSKEDLPEWSQAEFSAPKWAACRLRKQQRRPSPGQSAEKFTSDRDQS